MEPGHTAWSIARLHWRPQLSPADRLSVCIMQADRRVLRVDGEQHGCSTYMAQSTFEHQIKTSSERASELAMVTLARHCNGRN